MSAIFLALNLSYYKPTFSPSTFSSSASWIFVIVSDMMLLKLLNIKNQEDGDKMTGNTWTNCDNFFQFLFQRGSVHNKTDPEQRHL